MTAKRDIGTIGNLYGCLEVAEENDKFYWNIEGCLGDNWEEIPKYLFDALNKFENEREKKNDEV